MLRSILSSLVFALTIQVGAQTYFYIDEITIQPTNPTTADNVEIDLTGGLASTGAYISSASATIVNYTVTIDITAMDSGGATVIVPHTETISLGMLAAGQYTIVINGTNVADFVLQGQHFFEVTAGGSFCDSLSILSIQWHTFTDTAIVVHIANMNTNVGFDNPSFIFFGPNGDTIAIETPDLFVLPNDSWHILQLVDDAVIPESPFLGTLELWTNSISVLACSWMPLIDLCPTGPCSTVYPMIQNLGGAITIGNFQWSITDENGTIVENGIFSLPGTNETDRDTVCLEPGSYQMTCVPFGPPGGGQPYYSVVGEGINSTVALQAFGGSLLDLEVLIQCSSGTNSISESSSTKDPIIQVLNGMIEIRAGGNQEALGTVVLYNASGMQIASSLVQGPYTKLNTRSLSNGIYVLRVGNSVSKIMLEN